MGKIIINKRRCGNTTRMADEAIQLLFTKGEVRVFDHHGSNLTNLLLLKIILERLSREHGLKKVVYGSGDRGYSLKSDKILYSVFLEGEHIGVACK